MINRKHLRRAAKLATKVSPIPIPDIVKEQLEGTTDKMSELTEKIDKLQKSLDTIIEIFEMEPIVIDGSDTPLDFLFEITIAAMITAAAMPPTYMINELSVPLSSGVDCAGWAEAKVLM